MAVKTAARAELRTVETSIPARMDRLPWSRWHWLVVIVQRVVVHHLPRRHRRGDRRRVFGDQLGHVMGSAALRPRSEDGGGPESHPPLRVRALRADRRRAGLTPP